MRDAARKLLSVSWRRAPTGGETHSSPPAAAASRSPTRRALRYALIGAGTLAGIAAVCAGAGYVAIDRLGPPDLADDAECLDDRPRPPRPAAARLHDAGRTLAPSRRSRATSTSATSPCSWHSRTSASTDHGGVDMRSLARAAVPAHREPPHRLRRLDAHHAGRAPDRRPLRALRQRQAAPDRRRAAARASPDKQQILSLYLRLAPFGGNIEGVRAASLAYFGKEPRRLSVGEAALLVALPQSPEWRRPDRNPRRGAPRARPRAAAGDRGRRHHGRRGRTRRARAGADRPPRIPQARAAPRRSRSGRRPASSRFTA